MSNLFYQLCGQKAGKLGICGPIRFLGWLAFLIAAGWPAFAQSLTEHQMQAAVLGNLAKFVEWPKGAEGQGPLTIGILGHDPFGKDLEEVLKEVKVKGRNFAVKRSDKIQDLLECQIIYCSARETEELRQARPQLEGRPILTVGEDRRFLEWGGMVNFHMEEKKVRFAVNLKSAEEAGLSINPQLLRLATEVKK